MNPMDTAPLDGSRILVLTRVHHFNSREHKYMPVGTRWVEARFVDGKFVEWCGTEKTRSTGTLDPLSWAPVPHYRLGEMT